MITLTAAETGEDTDLYGDLPASRAYLDAVYAKTNIEARRQSLAGLRALLFLLAERGVDPRPLVLARAAGGKPYFANSPLRFGVSHSCGLAVCALGDEPIGVDTEKVRAKKNIETFAKRFFSPDECAIISRAGDKNYAFFEIWTKKEAALKRRGGGIDSPLAALDTAHGAFSVFDFKARDGDYIVTVAGKETVRIIGGWVWKKRE